ncbi:hypothetical protein AeRB84_004275 [Aphanomyces euteiches]|nr:hypothetical protein AeRB84_004275 [Aphanomyces euteiches]
MLATYPVQHPSPVASPMPLRLSKSLAMPSGPSNLFARHEIPRHEINLDVLRHLAEEENDAFSDDESDGVDSERGEEDDDDSNAEETDEDIDTFDTVLVPLNLPSSYLSMIHVKSPQDQPRTPPMSPHDDSWTLVDKSPTFECVQARRDSWSLK